MTCVIVSRGMRRSRSVIVWRVRDRRRGQSRSTTRQRVAGSAPACADTLIPTQRTRRELPGGLYCS